MFFHAPHIRHLFSYVCLYVYVCVYADDKKFKAPANFITTFDMGNFQFSLRNSVLMEFHSYLFVEICPPLNNKTLSSFKFFRI